MAVKLSSFLSTSFTPSALDSAGVIAIIETAAATMPLDSGTSGNYIKDITAGGGIDLIGTNGHAASITVLVDSSEIATVNTAQTLTNKTINLTSNTLAMTLNQLNAAISGGQSVASLTGTEILTNKTLTSPVITNPISTGGSVSSLSTFGLKDVTTTTYQTKIVSNNVSPVLSADRTLTLDVNNANRTFSLTGDLSTVGGNSLTLTTTGSTNVTFPTSGTLVSKDSSGNATVTASNAELLDSQDGTYYRINVYNSSGTLLN